MEVFTRVYPVFLVTGVCRFTSSLAEITLLDSNVIIYKFVQDLHFFVTGGDDENEIILASVLQGFFDAITLLLRYFRLDFLFLSRFYIQMHFTHHASVFSPIISYVIYRNNVDKREALENLDLILLCLDEIVDGGYAYVISHISFLILQLFYLFSRGFLP